MQSVCARIGPVSGASPAERKKPVVANATLAVELGCYLDPEIMAKIGFLDSIEDGVLKGWSLDDSLQ